jgi:NADPH:quinone reductase-like Zn-dependent oxidoreductase
MRFSAVRAIGADHVVDYTQEDFTSTGQRYDLILEMAGNRSLADLRRALTPKGTLVLVGGSGLVVLKELLEAGKLTPVIAEPSH